MAENLDAGVSPTSRLLRPFCSYIQSIARQSASRTQILDALDDAVARLIRVRIQARINDRLRARSGLALEPAQLYLLRTLAAAGPTRLGEVARLCALDQSTISRQVHTLDDRGLISRQPDPNDRRAHTVELNERGRNVGRQLADARLEFLDDALKTWTAADVRRLTILIDELATSLEHAEDPHPIPRNESSQRP